MTHEVRVSTDYEAKVGRIEWSRPEFHNAFTAKMTHDICDALTQLEHDDDIVTVMLGADGPDTTVGFDATEAYDVYREMPGGKDGRVPATRARAFAANTLWWGSTGLFSRVATSVKVTVLLAHGRAYGPGLYLATFCDLVVATEDVRFAHPAWSLVGINGDVGFLIETIGLKRANEFALLGKVMGGEEAWALGLVDSLVPVDELDQAGDEVAGALAAVMRDGITHGTYPRNSILQKMGLGTTLVRALMAETQASSIHHRAGEFNFLRERREHGVDEAIRLAKAYYSPSL